MKIIWDDEDRTYVRVEIMGSTYQIPATGSHPDWENIKAMVEAGQLVIGDYQPPQLPSD